MDMWNWLYECYKDGVLSIEELELVMTDNVAARSLWEEFCSDSGDFIDEVRDEVGPFLHHLKDLERKRKQND